MVNAFEAFARACDLIVIPHRLESALLAESSSTNCWISTPAPARVGPECANDITSNIAPVVLRGAHTLIGEHHAKNVATLLGNFA